MKKLLLFLLMILSLPVFAQTNPGKDGFVEMADQLREDGKIWIVVAVLLIVLIGLLVYVISVDRKINKIEKTLTHKDR